MYQVSSAWGSVFINAWHGCQRTDREQFFAAREAAEELEERSTDTEVEYFLKLSVFVSAAVGHCSNN